MNGRALIVDDYMATQLTTLSPGDSIHHAAKLLLDRRLSGAPVLNQSKELVGVLSKRDCLAVLHGSSYHQEWGGYVSDYMSRKLTTIAAGTHIGDAADLFLNTRFRRFPVMQDRSLVGQISRCDLLSALMDMWPSQSDVSAPNGKSNK